MAARTAPRAKRRAPARTERRATTSAVALAPEWRAWAWDNLARGAPRRDVVAALRAQGVPLALARDTVRAMSTERGWRESAWAFAQRARRLEQALVLQREVARTEASVERRADVSRAEFFARYYAANAPVVLTDVVTRWPALARWTPAYLKEHFGSVEVAVTDGREGDPDYDMHTAAHTRHVRLSDFVDRVVSAGPTNDFYLVANNRNMDRAGLAALWDDVVVPSEYLDATRRAGCAAFWFGPGGTVTPMHHDTSNILFCQVYGAKRFQLVSPREPRLFDATRGVYSAVDPERPDLARFPWWRDVSVHTVDLAPGDALFIPVGWWHHVRATSVSINLAFTNFVRANQFDWYKPGMNA